MPAADTTLRLQQLIATLNLSLVQGVSAEIEHFMPDSWSWAVEGQAFQVFGPWSVKWQYEVGKLCNVLAYAEGSLLRRISKERHEFYTWMNSDGDGFKVIFVATPS